MKRKMNNEKDEMSDKKFNLGIAGLLILMVLIGILLGYFVGVRIAENFYFPQLENCANGLWL